MFHILINGFALRSRLQLGSVFLSFSRTSSSPHSPMSLHFFHMKYYFFKFQCAWRHSWNVLHCGNRFCPQHVGVICWGETYALGQHSECERVESEVVWAFGRSQVVADGRFLIEFGVEKKSLEKQTPSLHCDWTVSGRSTNVGQSPVRAEDRLNL